MTTNGLVPDWFRRCLDFDPNLFPESHRSAAQRYRDRLIEEVVRAAQRAHSAAQQLRNYDSTGNIDAAMDHLAEMNRRFTKSRIELRDEVNTGLRRLDKLEDAAGAGQPEHANVPAAGQVPAVSDD